MKILSISFGFNGSISFLDNGKVIRHNSFNKINYNNDRDIIKNDTLSKFFKGLDVTINDIDYFVFAGFDVTKFENDRVDFIPDDFYDLPDSSTYHHSGLSKKPVKSLMSLLPPFTNRPYDYISGHFLYNSIVKPAFIVSPDLSYNSFGYFSSNFTKSINITVSSNDFTRYDGSLITVSKNNNLSTVERPKLTVGKLYPKMTELFGFGLGVMNNTTICDLSTRYHVTKKLEKIVDEGVNNKLSDIKDNYELNFFVEHTKHHYNQKVERHKSIHYEGFSVDDIHSKYVLKGVAITQKVIENTIINLIKNSLKRYSSNFTNNITLSGDIFENRRLNTKILNTFKDSNIHISPINIQETMSLGAALYVNSMVGNRRVYDRSFLLSTSPYITDFNNNGEKIDYKLLKSKLSEGLVSFKNGYPECGFKTLGFTGLLFNVDCDDYDTIHKQIMVNPYEKAAVLVHEDKISEYFLKTEYTLDNNTIAKPLLPHIFRNFIHDDGYVNIFVVNDKTNKFLSDVLRKTQNDFLGIHNFTSTEKKHIIELRTIFEISSILDIDYLIIDGKQHLK